MNIINHIGHRVIQKRLVVAGGIIYHFLHPFFLGRQNNSDLGVLLGALKYFKANKKYLSQDLVQLFAYFPPTILTKERK